MLHRSMRVVIHLETELQRHMNVLASEIGSRSIGSAGNLAAAGYIRREFEASGLTVAEQRFDCPDWRCDRTSLVVDGEPLAAYANTFSRPCAVTAPLQLVRTVTDLESADLGGKIAVLCGELTLNSLKPKAITLYSVERDERIIAALEAKRPAAVITVNLQPPNRERIIEDADFAVPSATVTAEVGLRLAYADGCMAQLVIESQREQGYSANVVGTLPGARPERIVLCAHYDTKIDTPGAMDNASGVAALLALTKVLPPLDLPLGLEFVAFSDEEYLIRSDAAYMRDLGDQLGSVLLALNLDCVGQTLGATTITLMSHADALKTRLEAASARPGVVWVDPWIQSNQATFAWRGVPTVALTSYFAGISRLDHQPEDTVDWVSPAQLAEVVELVRALVESVQQETLAATRAPQP